MLILKIFLYTRMGPLTIWREQAMLKSHREKSQLNTKLFHFSNKLNTMER